MRVVEAITARGHRNILSRNKSTFEITKKPYVTKQGDCIVAVAANKSVKDLSDEFKQILKEKDAKLTIIIQADSESEMIEAFGSQKLTLSHCTDLVVRKSSFVCDRTLSIKANKAAIDFSRNVVTKLRNGRQKVDITLTVEGST